jgi:hypothetical protein
MMITVAAASATTYDADLTITGTAGSTTFTQSMDIDGTALQLMRLVNCFNSYYNNWSSNYYC